MELRLLGPVEVIADNGIHVQVGVPQRRAALAAFAVDAGRLVTRETLIDRIWDQAPPASVQAAVYSHVSGIRRLLDQLNGATCGGAQVRLQRQPGGYVLMIDPDAVDLHRFQRLVAGARDADDRERAAMLRQALGLWRGDPLAGVVGAWGARMRQSWIAQRLDAVVAWARAELATGDPGAVVGLLTDLSGEYPLHEPLIGVLMRALTVAGRISDALECYSLLQRRLADELGTDPGGELQALHRAILRGDVV